MPRTSVGIDLVRRAEQRLEILGFSECCRQALYSALNLEDNSDGNGSAAVGE